MKRKKIALLLTIIFSLSVILFSQTITKTKSQITIRDAWIRPASAEANTALFLEIVNNNNRPDTLLSANAKISEMVEVHETYKKENDLMGMREVHKVVIPANGTVMFKPRGLHVMIIGLLKDIRLGEKHEFSLVFKNAGKIKIKALVRDMPAMR